MGDGNLNLLLLALDLLPTTCQSI